jgi:hypothetical protein
MALPERHRIVGILPSEFSERDMGQTDGSSSILTQLVRSIFKPLTSKRRK